MFTQRALEYISMDTHICTEAMKAVEVLSQVFLLPASNFNWPQRKFMTTVRSGESLEKSDTLFLYVITYMFVSSNSLGG